VSGSANVESFLKPTNFFSKFAGQHAARECFKDIRYL
jgi:hypothetical protein